MDVPGDPYTYRLLVSVISLLFHIFYLDVFIYLFVFTHFGVHIKYVSCIMCSPGMGFCKVRLGGYFLAVYQHTYDAVALDILGCGGKVGGGVY